MEPVHDFVCNTFLCTHVACKIVAKTIGKSNVAISCNMEMFNLSKRILLRILQNLTKVAHICHHIKTQFSVNFLSKSRNVYYVRCRCLRKSYRDINKADFYVTHVDF